MARLAGIVGAVTAAMSVPAGTAVCVYALWFLLGEKWKDVYSASTLRGGGRPWELHEAAGPARWSTQTERESVRPPRPSDWR